jgi:hypothetical protein
VADVVGLLVAEATAVAFGLAEVLACAVGLPQMVPPFLARFVVPLGLAVPVPVPVPVPVAVAVALDVGFAGFGLLLALLVALGLGLSESPAAGLVSGLGDGLDGLAEADVVAGGFDVAADVVGEAAADDCGQDAIGVGRWFPVAADGADPAPLAAAWPPRPAAAGLVTLVELLPSKAADTDELTAWRSGGTEASTTPTANTAQARAMAGLIRAARQPCCTPRLT